MQKLMVENSKPNELILVKTLVPALAQGIRIKVFEESPSSLGVASSLLTDKNSIVSDLIFKSRSYGSETGSGL